MKEDYIINAIDQEKWLYTYSQSPQISGQTGFIGYLRGDFGKGGDSFYTSWFDHDKFLNDKEFKETLDQVVNHLRFTDAGFLQSRNDLEKFAYEHPECIRQGTFGQEYGFQVETGKYSFLFRCNANMGDYNVYCYCYLSKRLNSHIQKASDGIRFIDSSYKELFRIADGERIEIESMDMSVTAHTCRYIDDTHIEIGHSIYHICQFAEMMETMRSKYRPEKKSVEGEERGDSSC